MRVVQQTLDIPGHMADYMLFTSVEMVSLASCVFDKSLKDIQTNCLGILKWQFLNEMDIDEDDLNLLDFVVPKTLENVKGMLWWVILKEITKLKSYTVRKDS